MNKGIESLKAAVMKDCAEGENCFSENGCTKVRHNYLPEDNPNLIAMGIKTKCVAATKCTHDYCGKYKWVMERAQHYAEKSGKTVEEVLQIWETDRDYWYMNYYQDCKQPLINSESIIDYWVWIGQLTERFGSDRNKWAFKCPSCGNVQTMQDFIDHGIQDKKEEVFFNCIGRYVKGKGCDWSLGGLLQINKVAVFKDAQVFPVFEMAEPAPSPKPRILKLTVTKKWFDMISSGEKKEEYREFKQYWINRLCDKLPASVISGGDIINRHSRQNLDIRIFDFVDFKNGYGKSAPKLRIECLGISVGEARPDWSDHAQGDYFKISLGEIVG